VTRLTDPKTFPTVAAQSRDEPACQLSPAFRVLQLLKCAIHGRHHVGAVPEGGKGAISGGQGSDPSLTGTFARTRFSGKVDPMDPGGHELRLRRCTSSAAVGEISVLICVVVDKPGLLIQ